MSTTTCIGTILVFTKTRDLIDDLSVCIGWITAHLYVSSVNGDFPQMVKLSSVKGSESVYD